MILRIILFVLFLLIITTLLFFITCILSPAVSEQTGITDNFLLSKAEYNFKKLGKLDRNGVITPSSLATKMVEKLDDVDYADKLTAIIANNNIKSVTVVRMEVPCCGGIEHAVKTALQSSGKFIPWQVVTISTDGKILS